MSSLVGITTFLVIRDSNDRVKHRFQNSEPGRRILKADTNPDPRIPMPAIGINYNYLSFIYQGAAKNRTGDNMEAQLVLAQNELSMQKAYAAVTERWNIQATTCIMDPMTFAVKRELTSEHWIAASMVYDPEIIEITLSSSIDAVGVSAPHKVLTTAQVGALPVSSQIQNI
jgi:hypothetical protein